MDVAEALRERRTVRAFLSRPIARETLDAILRAALATPSWANTQPWEIYVAEGEALERIRSASVERTHRKVPGAPEMAMPQGWPEKYRLRTKELTAGQAEVAHTTVDDPVFHHAFVEGNRRFFDAPCVAYLCLERGLSPWSMFDLGALGQSIMLAAKEQGVDSATAINFVLYPDVIRQELGMPEDLLIVIGIALGYADRADPNDSFRSKRRSLEDAVKYSGS